MLLLTAQWKLCNSMIEDTFMYDEDETYLMMKVHGEAVLKERGQIVYVSIDHIITGAPLHWRFFE